jgi:hypothetical protein
VENARVITNSGTEKTEPQKTPAETPWDTLLAATGTESRVGDAVNAILEQEQGSTLAGVILLTDGRSNAGIDPINVVSDATNQEVRLHPVGLGTDKNPNNVRLLDVEAPKRVFPGDRFRITALLQASGLQGTQIPIQLRRRPGGQSNAAPTIEEERTVALGGDDQITNLKIPTPPTTPLKPKSASSNPTRRYCSSLAGRHASTSSSGTCSIETRRCNPTSICNQGDQAFPKKPNNCSPSFLKRELR